MKTKRICADLQWHPGEKYAERNRCWQGCPTILCTPKGRLFAGWYSGGTMEPSYLNYNLLVFSDDGGNTWSPPLLAVESRREHFLHAVDIQLFLDPSGKCRVFWGQRFYRPGSRIDAEDHVETWEITCDDPDAGTLRWSAPRYVTDGYLRCRPTVLSDGRWIACAYDWRGDRYHYSESSDRGISWVRRTGGIKLDTDFDESMVYERQDGSLVMLARAAASYGSFAESVSTDGGATWSRAVPGNLAAPQARFFIRRLPSGKLLWIGSDSRGTERKNMCARLSGDDGASWSHPLPLSVEGSYPDAAIGPDGRIHAVFDRGRCTDKEIVYASFDEREIVSGELRIPLRIISRAPGEIPIPADEFERQRAEDMALRDQLMAGIF